MFMHAGARTGSTARLGGRFLLLPTVVVFLTLASAPRATRTPENHSFDAIRSLPFAAAVDDEFEVIDLGTLGGSFSQARAVNASGQVVGTSTTDGDAETHAFSWTATGGMIDLGTLGGSESSVNFKWPLRVVNDSGQVVGSSSIAGDAEVHAFRGPPPAG